MAQSKGVLSVLRTEDLMKRNTALKVHRLNEICTLVNILLRNNNCSPAPACWKHKGGFFFFFFFTKTTTWVQKPVLSESYVQYFTSGCLCINTGYKIGNECAQCYLIFFLSLSSLPCQSQLCLNTSFKCCLLYLQLRDLRVFTLTLGARVMATHTLRTEIPVSANRFAPGHSVNSVR